MLRREWLDLCAGVSEQGHHATVSSVIYLGGTYETALRLADGSELSLRVPAERFPPGTKEGAAAYFEQTRDAWFIADRAI